MMQVADLTDVALPIPVTPTVPALGGYIIHYLKSTLFYTNMVSMECVLNTSLATCLAQNGLLEPFHTHTMPPGLPAGPPGPNQTTTHGTEDSGGSGDEDESLRLGLGLGLGLPLVAGGYMHSVYVQALAQAWKDAWASCCGCSHGTQPCPALPCPACLPAGLCAVLVMFGLKRARSAPR